MFSLRRLGSASFYLLLSALCACGGASSSGAGASALPPAAIAAVAATDASLVTDGRDTIQQGMTNGSPKRPHFLGAFFRAQGPPPYGVFSTASPEKDPKPYPAPRAALFGSSGYCDEIEANGYSIATGHVVDATKLKNMADLGVGWTRLTVSQYFTDLSHIFGAGAYAFGDMDSAQCAVLRTNIIPMIGLEAGPIQYNLVPGVFAPVTIPTYQTAADFGAYCGVIAQHEQQAFPTVNRYSIPGNEVNSSPDLFPGGESQIAAYTMACYKAIKAVQPTAIVYGLELNMMVGLNPAAFVGRLYALGCRPGTCYDRIALHLEMPYPVPAATTPCFPNAGGSYSLMCIQDIQTAAHAKIQVAVSETVYTIPGSVPDEATKATATVAAFKAFATDTYVDGVSYANVDECPLYASGFFSGGCLVDANNTRLPAYAALQSLAAQYYFFSS